MIKRILFSVLFSTSIVLNAQPHRPHCIFGKVTDAGTKQPISQVIFFISSQQTVTVSDQHGGFKINGEQLTPMDTLYISHPEYQSQKMLFADIHKNKPLNIALQKKKIVATHSASASAPLFYKKCILKNAPEYQPSQYPQSSVRQLMISINRCILNKQWDYLLSYLLVYDHRKTCRHIFQLQQKHLLPLQISSLQNEITFILGAVTTHPIKTPETPFNLSVYGISYTIFADKYGLRLLVKPSWIK